MLLEYQGAKRHAKCLKCRAEERSAYYQNHKEKYQVEYEPLNVNEYQKQYEAQQVKYLKKRAAKFGFPLIPT
jgi:hypothetical protein